MQRFDETEVIARHARAVFTDPADLAEMGWILAMTLHHTGRYVDSLSVVDESLALPELPEVWRARLRGLRAQALPMVGWREEGKAEALRALVEGERLGDRVATATALQMLYLLADHETGVRYLDRALDVVGEHPESIDTRIALLTNHAYSLEQLGRSEPAEASMRTAVILAEQVGTWRLPRVLVHLAEQHIDAGRWDDAWAELHPMTGEHGQFERLLRTGGLAFLAPP